MTVGRVTHRMLTDGSLGNLQLGLGRLAKVQEQLSTGRLINRPSDDPTGTTAAMRLRSSMSEKAQVERNVQDGLGWLSQADAALGSATEAVRRARDLALTGANASASSTTSREALAVEVDALRDTLLSVANAAYLDRPVFGGVTAGQVAYDQSGAWVGTPGDVNRRISGDSQIKVDVPGPDAFGDGATSVFAELTALSAALRAGDQSVVAASVDTLNARMDAIVGARTAAGARYERLEKVFVGVGDEQLDLDNRLSVIERADLTATTVDLKMQEVAYQAALAATSRVMQPSLLDFLR